MKTPSTTNDELKITIFNPKHTLVVQNEDVIMLVEVKDVKKYFAKLAKKGSK